MHQTGAEHLDLPQVTYGLEAEVDGDTIKVRKEVEEGVEVIGVKTPCVVTFTKPAWDPRYPTIKRKMAANRAALWWLWLSPAAFLGQFSIWRA